MSIKSEFISKYDLNEVADFCYNHTNNEVFEKYNLSFTYIQQNILKPNDFHPTREQTINKRKLTCLERYGVENPFASDRIKQKIENTCLDKYGVKHISESNAQKEKSKQTCIEKYGVEHYSQTKEYKEKLKTNSQLKYGIDSPNQLDEVKKKKEQTYLKKYGVKNPSQANEVKEKKKQTCLEHFGTDYPLQNKNNKIKAKRTCIDKYGVEFYSQSKKGIEKIRQTCLEKYGVPYYCMTENCKNASNGCHSKPNENFAKLLSDNEIEFTREFPVERYSYDFKVGDVLIEINPTATHNSTIVIFGREPIDSLYHQNKTLIANKNGYSVIHIFDWDNQEKIVNLLKHRTTVYARKCEIRLIDNDIAKEFLNSYHLQGYVKADINIGLYYDDSLISLMTFGKPRYNKNYEYELLRYCSIYNVVGGEEKLWSYFINNYSPNSVISYCDLSKFSGKIYEKLGFISANKKIKPSKHWVEILGNRHVTDNLLRQRGFDQLFGNEFGKFGKGTSNEELMKQFGFVEVYDCGQKTYTWKM